MAEEKPNPLTAHLLNMVQGRQQTEVAKLTLLSDIVEKLERIGELLGTMETELHELVERAKER